ncbi:hypothetical protein BACPEC_01997 [[Bacteroides] pectinophilus ATCC 43243]|uniref:Uncharacterized protein n=1 Tax=[Bacteroides] pectinophilus ATCC 43243 TaxID=483218 RepID=B7ASE2_9FIRM|nr:hypothetical protein BACPEC_01997 [[Bacteroides] pectinophilus ATCC 43243]
MPVLKRKSFKDYDYIFIMVMNMEALERIKGIFQYRGKVKS